MLEKINSSQDVKKLNLKEKEILAQEIRKYILDIVSKMADIWHQTWGL